jgi:predicted Zn-ribbon and HTH transcriptional regulator
MYVCLSCGFTFERPYNQRDYENDETYSLCPRCKGESWEPVEEDE